MRKLLNARDFESLNRALRRTLERVDALARECLLLAGSFAAADNRFSIDVAMSVLKDRMEDLVAVEKSVDSALNAWAAGEKTAEEALEIVRTAAEKVELGKWSRVEITARAGAEA